MSATVMSAKWNERDGNERDGDERDGDERDGDERDGDERDGQLRATVNCARRSWACYKLAQGGNPLYMIPTEWGKQETERENLSLATSTNFQKIVNVCWKFRRKKNLI